MRLPTPSWTGLARWFSVNRRRRTTGAPRSARPTLLRFLPTLARPTLARPTPARPTFALPPAGRPSRRRQLVAVGVAVLLLAGTGWLLLGSGLFVVRTVSVTGPSALPPAEVRTAARVPAHAPLALVDLGAVQRRVAAIPAVASASVERVWPHGVHITVTARVPLLAVPRGSRFALVDRTGTAYATVARPPKALPIAPLAAVSPNDPHTRAVLDVVVALPTSVRVLLSRVEAPTPDSVTLLLRDGRRVLWGSAQGSARKAVVLRALLPHQGSRYDVSAPDIVTVSK